jgi:hypothetical protein
LWDGRPARPERAGGTPTPQTCVNYLIRDPKIWQWVQFSIILLPQLRVKTQGYEEKSGVKGRLRKLVQTLIQASLQNALLNM